MAQQVFTCACQLTRQPVLDSWDPHTGRRETTPDGVTVTTERTQTPTWIQVCNGGREASLGLGRGESLSTLPDETLSMSTLGSIYNRTGHQLSVYL